eukprot:794661-Prorocentrum_lima.AAC.1
MRQAQEAETSGLKQLDGLHAAGPLVRRFLYAADFFVAYQCFASTLTHNLRNHYAGDEVQVPPSVNLF